MKKFVIEKQFEHNGYPCVIIATQMGHRCGYVGISNTNKLYQADCAKENTNLTKNNLRSVGLGKRDIIPLFGCDPKSQYVAPDIFFDVHGSITYSGIAYWQKENDLLWYLGFDCAHAGDAKDLNIILDEKLKAVEIEMRAKYPTTDEVVRTTEYVAQECINLANQLFEFEWGAK